MLLLRGKFSKFSSMVNNGAYGILGVHLILYFMENFKGKHGGLLYHCYT